MLGAGTGGGQMGWADRILGGNRSNSVIRYLCIGVVTWKKLTTGPPSLGLSMGIICSSPGFQKDIFSAAWKH